VMDLTAAARKGDLAAVLTFLAQGADPSVKESRGGDTLLHLAAESGNPDLVRWLIEHGADPNTTNNAGATALDLAAGKRDLEVVRCLVEHGAELYEPEGSFTLLHGAALSGNAELVHWLLERGFDPNAKIATVNQTPIITAACGGNSDPARRLLEYGADPKAKTFQGVTALHWAVARG
jgi:uncharacterized protein